MTFYIVTNLKLEKLEYDRKTFGSVKKLSTIIKSTVIQSNKF